MDCHGMGTAFTHGSVNRSTPTLRVELKIPSDRELMQDTLEVKPKKLTTQLIIKKSSDPKLREMRAQQMREVLDSCSLPE
jgi:hypothetical protein